MQKTYLTLDTQKAGSQVSVQAKLGDTGRMLIISLKDGGSPFELPDDAYAVLMARKPDGNLLYNNVSIVDQKLIYNFTLQTATTVGTTECEVRLYRPNGAAITTARFDLVVDDTVYDDTEIQSTSEYTALTDLIAQLLDILQNRETAITKLNGKLPDELGALTLTSSGIDMDAGEYGFEGQTITEALDAVMSQLAEMSQELKDTNKDVVRTVNRRSPDSSGKVEIEAIDITTQQEEWPYQGTVDDALDELCAMIKLRITEKRAQEIVTAALAEYALKSYVDDKNGELSASMANLAGQTQERIAEIARTTSEQIGDLSKLSTQAKSNLVAALNEVAGRPSGSVNSVNGINPDSEGNVALNATKIPADGSTGSQSIAEALESGLADKQNKITAKGLLQGDGNGNVSGTKYIDLNKDGEISNTKTVGFYFESDGEDRGFYICAEEPDADKLIATAAIYGNAGDEPVRLKNIATPKDASDAANKGYVDSAITAALAAVPFAEEVTFGG